MQPTVAPVSQVLTGQSVGATDHAVCTGCKRAVAEGEGVTVYAYRQSDETQLSVAQVWCWGCGRRELRTPTLGAAEWVARARLAVRSDVGEQTTAPVLTNVYVLDRSGPADGAVP